MIFSRNVGDNIIIISTYFDDDINIRPDIHPYIWPDGYILYTKANEICTDVCVYVGMMRIEIPSAKFGGGDALGPVGNLPFSASKHPLFRIPGSAPVGCCVIILFCIQYISVI